MRRLRNWGRFGALAGILCLALALSACGRKGPLDLPPSAGIGPDAVVTGPDGAIEEPIAKKGRDYKNPKTRTPLDPLLD